MGGTSLERFRKTRSSGARISIDQQSVRFRYRVIPRRAERINLMITDALIYLPAEARKAPKLDKEWQNARNAIAGFD